MFIYLARVSKNIEVLPTQPSTTGFYNLGGKCLLRGTTLNEMDYVSSLNG